MIELYDRAGPGAQASGFQVIATGGPSMLASIPQSKIGLNLFIIWQSVVDLELT